MLNYGSMWKGERLEGKMWGRLRRYYELTNVVFCYIRLNYVHNKERFEKFALLENICMLN